MKGGLAHRAAHVDPVRDPKKKVRVESAVKYVTLLDGIDVSNLVGLRDRAFLGVLVYSFARERTATPRARAPPRADRQRAVVDLV